MNPFKLPWPVYLAAGLVFAALAALFYNFGKEDDAKRTLALRSPPPKAVGIEKFSRAVNSGPSGEIIVIGQADVDHWAELSETKNGEEKRHWTLIPLYAADATDPIGASPGMIVADGVLNRAEIAKMTTGQGPFGPILRIDGEIAENPATYGSDARNELARMRLNGNAVMVAPYKGSRIEELQPRGPGLAIVTGVIGLLLILYAFFRRWREPIEEANYYA